MNNLVSNKKKYSGRIVIMHDYFRVLGGAEKLVIDLAQNLKIPIITSEASEVLIRYIENKKVKLIVMGKLTQFPLLLPPITSKRFSECDFSKDFDKFIFSGSFSIYAAQKHKPNIWYCHTPLKGLYFNDNSLQKDNL